jgi:Family of unknown function (DUF6221)
MTDDIVEWLRGVHAHVEDVARHATQGRWKLGGLDEEEIGDALFLGMNDSRHVELHDPASVLARIEAERAILDGHAQVAGEWRYRGRPAANPDDPRGCQICHEHDGIIISAGVCHTVKLLAWGWRYRHGYRKEWAPS